MLDKNRPSLEEFHIQLWSRIEFLVAEEIEIPSHPVSDTPTLLNTDLWKIRYPRNYKELFSLVVCHWKFPEVLFWRVHLDLEENNFSWLNDSQRIILRVCLDSQETCEKFLFYSKQFSGRKIFGNILGNNFQEMLKSFRICYRKPKTPTARVWRRGYRDKGCRIPDHRWREKFDFSFTSEQERLEAHRKLIQKTILSIIEFLHNK